jgi:DNA repair protein RecN (Recombination protein N)
MLQRIYIRNFAIIQELDIAFNKGLQVITGETGAGKSILMGALHILLGDRFDSSKLYNATEKCVIEAHFNITTLTQVQEFLETESFDNLDTLIIRREMGVSGKSRSFINDTPASVQQLQQVAVLLVDLHKQFDTLSLTDKRFQTNVLDAFAGNHNVLAQYKTVYIQYEKVRGEYTRLLAIQADRKKACDYNLFLFNELDKAAFTNGEIENADAQLKIMDQSENIVKVLDAITLSLNDNEQPITAYIKQLANNIQPYSTQMAAIKELQTRLLAVYGELQDISDEALRIKDTIQFDEAKYVHYQERVNVGFTLLKKHNVLDTNALLHIHEALSKELTHVEHGNHKLIELEAEQKQAAEKALAIAQQISTNRKKSIPTFTNALHNILTHVEMPNAQLRIDINPTDLQETGIDEVQFLFDANKTGKFNSIQKVASGGELSRLMLCIKNLVANTMVLPTLIFDEIDSGISGEACKQVGIIMQELATQKQIICITHQPQIAAKGNAHYFVYKKEMETGVHTFVKKLNKSERIETIAQMIGGVNPSNTVLKNAKELLDASL